MSDDLDKEAIEAAEQAKKTAIALRLEKARQAKAEKKAKEAESETGTDKPKKKRRRSMSKRGPLSVPEDKLDPNYHYRFVEDSGWNMSDKRELGYEFVEDSTGSFEESDMVMKGSKFGNVVGRTSDHAGHVTYLMRMPKDEFLEAKEDERLEREKAMNAKPSEKGIYQKQFDNEHK